MAFTTISSNEEGAVKLQILNENLLGVAFGEGHIGKKTTLTRRQLGDPSGKGVRRCWNGGILKYGMGGEKDLIASYIRWNSKTWSRCRVPVGCGLIERS
jgi:hypothetical protein